MVIASYCFRDLLATPLACCCPITDPHFLNLLLGLKHHLTLLILTPTMLITLPPTLLVIFDCLPPHLHLLLLVLHHHS